MKFVMLCSEIFFSGTLFPRTVYRTLFSKILFSKTSFMFQGNNLQLSCQNARKNENYLVNCSITINFGFHCPSYARIDISQVFLTLL